MTNTVARHFIAHAFPLGLDKAVLRQRITIALPQRRQMPNNNGVKTVIQTRVSLEPIQLEKDFARNVTHRAREITEIAIHVLFVKAIGVKARDLQFVWVAEVQNAQVTEARDVILSSLALVIDCGGG